MTNTVSKLTSLTNSSSDVNVILYLESPYKNIEPIIFEIIEGFKYICYKSSRSHPHKCLNVLLNLIQIRQYGKWKKKI